MGQLILGLILCAAYSSPAWDSVQTFQFPLSTEFTLHFQLPFSELHAMENGY